MSNDPIGPECFGGSDEGSHYMSQTRVHASRVWPRQRIYIAAPYELREQAIEYMVVLERCGHRVTSTWLREMEEEGDKYARIDLAEVARADLLLLINPEEFRRSGTGGRHTEVGYALGLGKHIVILGVRSNIFHHLSDVRVIERIEDL